jgi:hypothetical protein
MFDLAGLSDQNPMATVAHARCEGVQMLALSRFPGIGLGLSRIAAVLGLLALLVTPNVHAWEVFMKSSPCAATLRDWITVAESNPTGRGGGNFYMPARGSGNVFPQSSAGFTAAHAGADAKRILGFLVSGESTMQEKYENYCCKDSTVWQRRMPDGSVNFSIRQVRQPGGRFQQVSAPMCCEQAAALAGTTAGCGTFQLSNERCAVHLSGRHHSRRRHGRDRGFTITPTGVRDSIGANVPTAGQAVRPIAAAGRRRPAGSAASRAVSHRLRYLAAAACLRRLWAGLAGAAPSGRPVAGSRPTGRRTRAPQVVAARPATTSRAEGHRARGGDPRDGSNSPGMSLGGWRTAALHPAGERRCHPRRAVSH